MRQVCFLNYFKVLSYSVPKLTPRVLIMKVGGIGNAVEIKTIAEY